MPELNVPLVAELTERLVLEFWAARVSEASAPLALELRVSLADELALPANEPEPLTLPAPLREAEAERFACVSADPDWGLEFAMD